MSARHKVLVLDDDSDVVELFQEILGQLPSQPEVHTATSGARALSLLESEPFTLLLTDLKMPKMDGLQVLTIVRRKFPNLRTAVMTSGVDEQFRARAYAVGVDLFLEKPNTSKEIAFFLDCIESLLGREDAGGFRGVQSKSLVDIIQLECLSQSSSVLRITNGPAEGKIWIQDGDVIDAVSGDLEGEEAFRRILSWKTGNFELLPPEGGRVRKIHSSYQGLLLETAQALDEAQAEAPGSTGGEGVPAGPAPSALAKLARFEGVKFLLPFTQKDKDPQACWGVEDPKGTLTWAAQTAKSFRVLGEHLHAGQLQLLQCEGLQYRVALLSRDDNELCVGFDSAITREAVRDTTAKMFSQWLS